MTLDEKLDAFCESIGMPDPLRAYPIGSSFRAGAAAMAELFAAGHGLRVEHVTASDGGLSVYHSPDCPVSHPDFVPDLTRNQCTCDFMKRLKQALGTPI